MATERSTPPGYVGQFDSLVHDLAAALVDQAASHRSEAGPPWRSKRLTQRQALARIDQYDQPSPGSAAAGAPGAAQQRFLEGLSDTQLVQAALEAIALRRRALARGEWTPPAVAVHPAGAPPVSPVSPGALASGGAIGAPAPPGPRPGGLPARESVGGEMVPAGAAAMERGVAAGAGLGAPTTQQQLTRGEVVPQ